MTKVKPEEIRIGSVIAYYGGVYVKKALNGLFYWGLENYNGINWEEIPESMYNELIKFGKTVKHE